MNRQEHLLTILGEECVEVAQRVSKAPRFGLEEVQPGQELTNADRICYELGDLLSVLEMLDGEGLLNFQAIDSRDHSAKKRAKIERFLEYSRACGTLVDD